MTTPQAVLHGIYDRIASINEILAGNEHTGNVTDILAQLEVQNDDIIASQQRLENLMNLIVKFLSKKEEDQ